MDDLEAKFVTQSNHNIQQRDNSINCFHFISFVPSNERNAGTKQRRLYDVLNGLQLFLLTPLQKSHLFLNRIDIRPE